MKQKAYNIVKNYEVIDDLIHEVQYALTNTKGQTMLAIYQYCDTIMLNFINKFVSTIEDIDRNVRYIFLYDDLETKMTFQKVTNIREGLCFSDLLSS